jgi:hypothetical protein
LILTCVICSWIILVSTWHLTDMCKSIPEGLSLSFQIIFKWYIHTKHKKYTVCVGVCVNMSTHVCICECAYIQAFTNHLQVYRCHFKQSETRMEIRQRTEICVLLLVMGYKVHILFTEIPHHNKEYHWTVISASTSLFISVIHEIQQIYIYSKTQEYIHSFIQHMPGARWLQQQIDVKSLFMPVTQFHIFLTTDDVIWTEKHLVFPSAAAIIYMTESELQIANLKMFHAWIQNSSEYCPPPSQIWSPQFKC